MENQIDKAIESLEQEQTVPQSIEFTVQEDFVKNLPQILSNCQQLKQWAIAQTEKDRTLVLQTDDDFDNAKKRCASINKVIQSIDNKRKDVKKKYSEPYEIFEKEIKEVTAVLTEAKNNLWNQVTKAEEEQKQSIEKYYRNWYEKSATDILQYRPFDAICKKTWLNKGVKANTVISEMTTIIEETRTAIQTILDLNSEFETSLMTLFKNGGTIIDVLSYNNRLKAEKEALEQRKVQARQSIQEQSQKTEETAKEPQTDDILITIDFRVEATKEQLQRLSTFMKENGIKYGKVPQGE